MSNFWATIIASLVGGAIAIIGSVVTLVFENKRWKQETKLQILREKRERLTNLFEASKDIIPKGYTENSYTIDFYSAVKLHFPGNVKQAFFDMIADDEKSREAFQGHYIKICALMDQHLAQIDSKIEKIVE